MPSWKCNDHDYGFRPVELRNADPEGPEVGSLLFPRSRCT